MRFYGTALLLSLLHSSIGVCHAQLVAFPGAEGAGALVSGGRGGDVYVVNTLADYASNQPTIVGSLRHAISSASGPRTIVFGVSGTIELARSLSFNRSNMTIAGQTAPGGGITLANFQTQVSANNVILQHMRFRPGDTNASTEPDSLWVSGSNGVMIDHVTASWSCDELLSVTHNSNNVTVQWSMITEPLHFTGHSNGPNHGYSSLLNGGDYTFHHNLYTHGSSRNPRPQGNTLRLDFVNNVLHNPGGRYGNSEANSSAGEGYQMNYVGNYGVDGPNTSAPSLMHAQNVGSRIFAEGNYRDANKNGILDGTPASVPSGTFTALPDRVNLPEINATSAQQAYVQVLSRAGANSYRDSVDRRIVHSVFNQTGAHIDSQNEVGGWPTLPSNSAPVDTNGDGVPDDWAIANGFAISNPLNSTFAPDGYTYLEKYIHSLTPYSYAPVGTEQIVIPTSFGRGGDAEVREIGDLSSGVNNAVLTPHFNNSTNNQYALLKFDLAGIQPGSITDARLEMTAFDDFVGTNVLRVYGLIHDASEWDWVESAVEFANAPGLSFDGSSTTRGLATGDVLTLGSWTVTGTSEGQSASFDNLNLGVFLNLGSYMEGLDQAGLVTLIVEKTTVGSNLASFASKEATHLSSTDPDSAPAGTFAPRLVLDAVLQEIVVPVLPGDFNNDGIVDAADYTVWRNHFGDETEDAINSTA